MNLLISCIGRRAYMAEYFRRHLDRGDRILGTSNSPYAAGFEACDLSAVMPDIADGAYIPTLLRFCREQKVGALLSLFDPDVDRLAPHLADFRSIGVTPILPTPEASEICFDKWSTYRFAMENGLPAPPTFIEHHEAVAAVESGACGWPVIVKPRTGFGSGDLFRAGNFKELEVFFHFREGMLVQQALPGREWHLDVLVDFGGRVLCVVPKRKISMRKGETDQAEIQPVPELLDFGVRLGTLLGKRGFAGPLDVDLFVDGDRITLLEMNARFGGGYPLSHVAGADFPRLILRLIRGEAVEPEIGRFEANTIVMKSCSMWGGKPGELLAGQLDLRDQGPERRPVRRSPFVRGRAAAAGRADPRAPIP